MRRALAVALIVGVVAAPAAGRTHAKPRLVALSTHPLTVRGTGFVPRERVMLRVFAQTKLSRLVGASTAGSFRAVFRRAQPLECGLMIVTATGSAGSHARLRLGAPECNPP